VEPYPGNMRATCRKPWLAALLSLPLAGLGHLYAGAPRKAAAFFGGELVTGLVFVLLLIYWASAPWNLVLGWAVFLGWRFFAAVDAYRYTVRATACVGRSAWIRWPAYVVIYLAGAYGPALARRATVVEAFRIPAGSMSETLIPGDQFLATKWNVGSPERGELVVFVTPGGANFVERVIGLPGDRVAVREGVAHVNGNPLAEPYVTHDGGDPGEYGPIDVPPGSYFVLGDNRNNSKDSRVNEIGFVPSDRIVGRPRAIYWSASSTTGKIRWNRLGRRLKTGTGSFSPGLAPEVVQFAAYAGISTHEFRRI